MYTYMYAPHAGFYVALVPSKVYVQLGPPGAGWGIHIYACIYASDQGVGGPIGPARRTGARACGRMGALVRVCGRMGVRAYGRMRAYRRKAYWRPGVRAYGRAQAYGRCGVRAYGRTGVPVRAHRRTSVRAYQYRRTGVRVYVAEPSRAVPSQAKPSQSAHIHIYIYVYI